MTQRHLVLMLLAFLFIAAMLPAGAATKTIFHLGDKAGNMPISPAILVRGTLYLSGQLAVDPASGEFVNGTMTQQSERILRNIEILLKKAGFILADVVSATVYISDFKEFDEFNTVFRAIFPSEPPTRTTVEVNRLARGAKIEISAIAARE